MRISIKKQLRRKRSIKKFQKFDFDFAKYVKDFFVEDGKAYISVKIDSLDEIISDYSIKDYEWINSEFAAYVEENAYYIPVYYPIVLDIYGFSFTEEEQEMIRKIIKDYYGLKLGDKVIDLKNNMRKAFTLLCFGLITIVITIFLSSFSKISMLFEVMAVIMWFALWEFIEYGWLERKELKKQKIEAGQLASITVKFN
ncbi:MAG: hypothetical protein PHO63_00375 [Bacilli bacterium]|nr:hypothetical protein [Bacilli bacterium]MDD4808675.1 hypothetical protein [Bacilli bacterium]